MKLAGIRPDDVVLVDKGGRLIYGLVQSVGDRELEFDALTRGITWRHAAAREVVRHWRAVGGRSRGR